MSKILSDIFQGIQTEIDINNISVENLNKNNIKFEDALALLTHLSEVVQDDNLPLDTNVEIIKVSKELKNYCTEKLQSVENEIERIYQQEQD